MLWYKILTIAQATLEGNILSREMVFPQASEAMHFVQVQAG
jgi:hypothetical protein